MSIPNQENSGGPSGAGALGQSGGDAPAANKDVSPAIIVISAASLLFGIISFSNGISSQSKYNAIPIGECTTSAINAVNAAGGTAQWTGFIGLIAAVIAIGILGRQYRARTQRVDLRPPTHAPQQFTFSDRVKQNPNATVVTITCILSLIFFVIGMTTAKTAAFCI